MTSTSLGSMPAWAIASLAAFTISDSLVSPSSLPNFPRDHPTIQAVMQRSFAAGRRPQPPPLGGSNAPRYVHIHLYCPAVGARRPPGDSLITAPLPPPT